jgi:hypothetical protein
MGLDGEEENALLGSSSEGKQILVSKMNSIINFFQRRDIRHGHRFHIVRTAFVSCEERDSREEE